MRRNLWCTSTILTFAANIALAANIGSNRIAGNRGEDNSALWLPNQPDTIEKRVKREADSQAPANITEPLDPIKYLRHYGYLAPNMDGNDSVAKLVSENELKEGVAEFQRFAHINQTGVLDEVTKNQMLEPRCSMQDIPHSPETGLRREKRYALAGSKWSEDVRGRLTYRIERYPSRFEASKSDVDQLFERAFRFWSQAAYVDFYNKKSGSVTFVIKFLARSHGDDYNFDGRGGDLAHAFYPLFGGAIHLDDDERWSIESANGTDMLWVAVHEIGHALGLRHSDKEDAIMWPWYVRYDPDLKLHPDDVAAVRAHYGTRNVVVVKKPEDPQDTITDSTIGAPELCKNPKFDAYISIGDLVYIFRNEFYWKPSIDNELGAPRRIDKGWPGAPNNIDTALIRDEIYLFKGDQYWTYNYKRQLKTGASPMSEWSGIPNDVDAAFLWPKNNKSYFFKGDKYWRYDFDTFSVDKMYPLSMREWKGVIFDRLDAVIANGDGTTFFVQGNRFLVYDDTLERVIGRPRSVRDNFAVFASCNKS